jgi:TIR domain/Effector-associated domain 11
MTTSLDVFSTHVAAGRLAEAAQELHASCAGRGGAELDELLALTGDITRLETDRRQRRLTREQAAVEHARLAEHLLALRRVLQRPPAAPARASSAAPATAAGAAVFISYNHADREAAFAVADALRAADIAVHIDAERMRAGQAIERFIADAVASTRATVCVLSRASLLSGWVAQETLLALAVQRLWGGREFIAAYLDTDFLAPDVRLALTDEIDARLHTLDTLRARHAAAAIDSTDLDAEHARLHQLRSGLGSVLERLRAGLSLDLRLPQRTAELQRLVHALAREPAR